MPNQRRDWLHIVVNVEVNDAIDAYRRPVPKVFSDKVITDLDFYRLGE